MNDIVERLRNWAIAVNAVAASDLMDEAADEIERLRHRVRFTDAVIRSGDAATLTDAEREAVECGLGEIDGLYPENAATLRGLLDRLKSPTEHAGSAARDR